MKGTFKEIFYRNHKENEGVRWNGGTALHNRNRGTRWRRMVTSRSLYPRERVRSTLCFNL